MKLKPFTILFALAVCSVGANAQGKFLGNLNSNQYDPNSVSNPYGQYGSKYSPDSVNNPYGRYGSPYSNESANNPYATNAPKVYDQQGNYKGNFTANPYDPNRINR